MQTIAIVNESSRVSHPDLVAARQALQVQLSRDFSPAWGLYATLLLRSVPHPHEPTIHLLDNTTVADALGYHDTNSDAPEGFVFVETAEGDGVPWQLVLSHELLEMLADPWIDLVADTVYQNQPAVVAYEVADPVEGDSYAIGSVPVSNFVLPSWFLPSPLPGAPFTDFLKRLTEPLALAPGGYFLYATQLGIWQQALGANIKAQDKIPQPYGRRFQRTHRPYATTQATILAGDFKRRDEGST
jgi:hypothetical protein